MVMNKSHYLKLLSTGIALGTITLLAGCPSPDPKNPCLYSTKPTCEKFNPSSDCKGKAGQILTCCSNADGGKDRTCTCVDITSNPSFPAYRCDFQVSSVNKTLNTAR